VVLGTSPLLLGPADRVVHLAGGRAVATGTHADLLATDGDYRALVSRGAAENHDDPAGATR
jgi:ABC-type multidrug transport system fused ATPase/permease subunit